MSLHFKAIKNGWIVAGSNDDAAGESAASNFKRHIGCWKGPIHQEDTEAVAGKHFSGETRKLWRQKPYVEAYEDRPFGAFYSFQIICRCLRRISDIFKCE